MPHTDYLSDALIQHKVAKQFEEIIDFGSLKFDLLVGTGLSGTIPLVAIHEMWGYNIGILRKDLENSHGYFAIENTLRYEANPRHWIFIDDFIGSGRTERRVIDAMREHYPQAKYLGAYLYSGRPRFLTNSSEPNEYPNIYYENVQDAQRRAAELAGAEIISRYKIAVEAAQPYSVGKVAYMVQRQF